MINHKSNEFYIFQNQSIQFNIILLYSILDSFFLNLNLNHFIISILLIINHKRFNNLNPKFKNYCFQKPISILIYSVQ